MTVEFTDREYGNLIEQAKREGIHSTSGFNLYLKEALVNFENFDVKIKKREMTGKWIFTPDGWECSSCNKTIPISYNIIGWSFCPHCGKKKKEVELDAK